MHYSLTRLPLSGHCNAVMREAGVDSMWISICHPTQLVDKATTIRYIVREYQDIMRFSIILKMPTGKGTEILDVPVCNIDEEFAPFSITRNDKSDGESLLYFSGYCVSLENAHVLCNKVIETDHTWKLPHGTGRWCRAYDVPVKATSTSRFGSEDRQENN